MIAASRSSARGAAFWSISNPDNIHYVKSISILAAGFAWFEDERPPFHAPACERRQEVHPQHIHVPERRRHDRSQVLRHDRSHAEPAYAGALRLDRTVCGIDDDRKTAAFEFQARGFGCIGRQGCRGRATIDQETDFLAIDACAYPKMAVGRHRHAERVADGLAAFAEQITGHALDDEVQFETIAVAYEHRREYQQPASDHPRDLADRQPAAQQAGAN